SPLNPILSVSIPHPHDDHRNLHSFPTRRSSDLHHGHMRASRCEGIGDSQIDAAGSPCDENRRPRKIKIRHKPSSRSIHILKHYRSEEHTSELQSRENLVCRLLLEKKKTTNSTPN